MRSRHTRIPCDGNCERARVPAARVPTIRATSRHVIDGPPVQVLVVRHIQQRRNGSRFPRTENYESDFVYFMTSDRPGNRTVRDLYANLTALESARDGAPLDHGSQFAMEVYAAVVDDAGEPVYDADGRMQKAGLKVVAVMEKQPGWGESYPVDIRNGDWEYGFFTGDGTLTDKLTTGVADLHSSPRHGSDS